MLRTNPTNFPLPRTKRGARSSLGWAVSLVVGTFVLAPFACTSNGDDTDSSSLINCTPNANVFCLCEDGARGTKRCAASGHAFGSCMTGPGGVCAREIQSDDTNKPVDDAGNVIEPDDAGSGDGEDRAVPPTSPIEACPGSVFGIPADTDIVVEGNTLGATDDAKGQGACSVGDQGPDHVYRLKPTGKGSLSIKVKGEGSMNPTVYLRSACEDESTQLKCAETTGPGGTETLQLNVKTGVDYFLFVDSSAGSEGKYTITARLTSGFFCGDDDVNTNEACDDGNKTENDGCSNSCQQPNGDPASGGSCPGHPVHIWPGKTVSATGSTTSYTNAWKNTGTSCTVSTNELNKWPDHTYQVVPHATGTLQVKLTPDPADNLMLVARTSCTNPQSQTDKMCANNGSTGEAETMSFPVTSGTPVFVAVDGAGSTASTKSYKISFAIQ